MTWRERNAAARARRDCGESPFTVLDRALAEHWTTCAVGEQAQMNERVKFIPMDERLSSLGHEFNAAVAREDIDAADSLLDQIEDRVLVLKREAE